MNDENICTCGRDPLDNMPLISSHCPVHRPDYQFSRPFEDRELTRAKAEAIHWKTKYEELVAKVEALADEWERNYANMLIGGFSGCSIGADTAARRLRALLDTDEALRADLDMTDDYEPDPDREAKAVREHRMEHEG